MVPVREGPLVNHDLDLPTFFNGGAIGLLFFLIFVFIIVVKVAANPPRD